MPPTSPVPTRGIHPTGRNDRCAPETLAYVPKMRVGKPPTPRTPRRSPEAGQPRPDAGDPSDRERRPVRAGDVAYVPKMRVGKPPTPRTPRRSPEAGRAGSPPPASDHYWGLTEPRRVARPSAPFIPELRDTPLRPPSDAHFFQIHPNTTHVHALHHLSHLGLGPIGTLALCNVDHECLESGNMQTTVWTTNGPAQAPRAICVLEASQRRAYHTQTQSNAPDPSLAEKSPVHVGGVA